MGIVLDKANMILKTVSPTAGQQTGAAPGGFLQIILQILTSLLGGLGACTPPVGVVHQKLSSPGPVERSSLRRTTRAYCDNPALRQPVEEAFLQVGAGLSPADSEAMYVEVNGPRPS